MDSGITHVALVVRDVEASIAFYTRFAGMRVIHQREAQGDIEEVVWMTDFTRPFALVLIASTKLHDTPVGPFGHLGVACASRAEVDRAADAARELGILRSPPKDSGPPTGYWTYLADPDGNTLELSHGQEIAFTVKDAQRL
ncbi:VOC family protein [Pseudomonas mangiferae]|nr:VOC family protein [Pseudomonas mangiferae]